MRRSASARIDSHRSRSASSSRCWVSNSARSISISSRRLLFGGFRLRPAGATPLLLPFSPLGVQFGPPQLQLFGPRCQTVLFFRALGFPLTAILIQHPAKSLRLDPLRFVFFGARGQPVLIFFPLRVPTLLLFLQKELSGLQIFLPRVQPLAVHVEFVLLGP